MNAQFGSRCVLISLIMYSCTSCQKSEAELEHIALHDPDPMRQRDAVCLRMSEETLTRIYYASTNLHVRSACVAYIDSVETLRKIAQDKTHSDVARGDAILKLNDRALARQIMSDLTDNSRGEAIKLLSPDEDEDLIKSVAFNKNENRMLRSVAIFRMKDQVAIKGFLETETDIQIRLAAASALTDSKLNEEMFYKEKNREVRMRMAISQNDENVLKKILRSETEETVRGCVVINIKDQDFLKKILNESSNTYEMIAAIKNIKDMETIEIQAESNKDPSVRQTAVEIITNREILKKIAESDPVDFVRIEASRRLRKL